MGKVMITMGYYTCSGEYIEDETDNVEVPVSEPEVNDVPVVDAEAR